MDHNKKSAKGKWTDMGERPGQVQIKDKIKAKRRQGKATPVPDDREV